MVCAATYRRGRKRDLTREIRNRELLSRATGTIEACRLVGASRKTGYRWRAEMGGVLTQSPPASWHDRGVSIREVARHVGRSPSRVSRKLRRNARDCDERYEPVLAHLQTTKRAKRPKVGKIGFSR